MNATLMIQDKGQSAILFIVEGKANLDMSIQPLSELELASVVLGKKMLDLEPNPQEIEILQTWIGSASSQLSPNASSLDGEGISLSLDEQASLPSTEVLPGVESL
jgi:hypothetical protein